MFRDGAEKAWTQFLYRLKTKEGQPNTERWKRRGTRSVLYTSGDNLGI